MNSFSIHDRVVNANCPEIRGRVVAIEFGNRLVTVATDDGHTRHFLTDALVSESVAPHFRSEALGLAQERGI